jgi:hypothetical protein
MIPKFLSPARTSYWTPNSRIQMLSHPLHLDSSTHGQHGYPNTPPQICSSVKPFASQLLETQPFQLFKQKKKNQTKTLQRHPLFHFHFSLTLTLTHQTGSTFKIYPEFNKFSPHFQSCPHTPSRPFFTLVTLP